VIIHDLHLIRCISCLGFFKSTHKREDNAQVEQQERSAARLAQRFGGGQCATKIGFGFAKATKLGENMG